MKYWLFFLLIGFKSLVAQTYQKHQVHLNPDFSIQEITEWLYQEYPILRKSNSQLSLTYDITSPGGRHLTFAQECEGIVVQHAGVKVNLDHEGRIWSSLSNLQPFGLDHAAFPPMDTALLRRTYGELVGADGIEIEPRWWVAGNRLIPAYYLKTFQPGPIASYEIWVDAHSKKELLRRDRSAHYHPSRKDSSGKGRVFIPDPCTRAGAEYGVLFTDQNDSHSEQFEALMDTVVLLDLVFSENQFRLEGPYVKIEDIRPFNLSPATSVSGDFFFDRSDAGFEDVMCYYHIDAFQRYIQSLGFTNLKNEPMRVDPHGQGNSDQSVFVSNGEGGYLLFGDGGVDDAEDADVIIHEYGHALSESAAPDTRYGFERFGLDEGIGDYLAASYSYDLSPWRWYELFNWDGQNEFWPGREAISQKMYPLNGSIASIYTYGELWASTLMQIRQVLGAEVTDRLFFQSLYSNFSDMSFPDAVQLLLDADSLLYQGAHSSQLTSSFCERNLLSSLSCLTVGLEPSSDLKEALQWRFSSVGSGKWNLTISSSSPAKVKTSFHDLTGRLIRSEELLPSSQKIFDFSILPSGVYFLRIEQGSWTYSEKFVLTP